MSDDENYDNYVEDDEVLEEERDDAEGGDDYVDDDEDDSPTQGKRRNSSGSRKSAAGRKLVRWSPELDQLTLLCVDSVCGKQGIVIPWNDVAKAVADHMSGEAIKQHLVKVVKKREEAKLKVPEKVRADVRRKAALEREKMIKAEVEAATKPTPRKNLITLSSVARKPIKKESKAAVVNAPKVSSLLYSKPVKEPVKRVSIKTAVARRIAAGSARKKTAKAKARESEDDTASDGGDESIPEPQSTGNKRNRKSSSESTKQQSSGSPSKKPRTEGYLRQRKVKTYAEPTEDDVDIEVDSDEEDPIKEESFSDNDDAPSTGLMAFYPGTAVPEIHHGLHYQPTVMPAQIPNFDGHNSSPSNENSGRSNELRRSTTVPSNNRPVEWEVGSRFGSLVVGGPPPDMLPPPLPRNNTMPLPIGMNAREFFGANGGFARAQRTGMPSTEEMMAAVYDVPVSDRSNRPGLVERTVSLQSQPRARFPSPEYLDQGQSGYFLGQGAPRFTLQTPHNSPRRNNSFDMGTPNSNTGLIPIINGTGQGAHSFTGFNGQVHMGPPSFQIPNHEQDVVISESPEEMDYLHANMNRANGEISDPSQLNSNVPDFTEFGHGGERVNGSHRMTPYEHTIARLHREAADRFVSDGVMVQGSGLPVDGLIPEHHRGVATNGVMNNDPFAMNGVSDVQNSQISSSIMAQDGNFGPTMPNSMLGSQDIMQRIDSHMINGMMNGGSQNQMHPNGLTQTTSFDSAYVSAPDNSSQGQAFNSLSFSSSQPMHGSFNAAEYEEESPFDELANEINMEYNNLNDGED